MIAKWRWVILGGGLGLYLAGVGFLGEMVLNQHDKAMRQRRTYLMRPEQQATAGQEASGALQSAHILERNDARVQRNASAGELAWHDAYGTPLGSRRWERQVEVGDASIQVGEPSGRKASLR